MADVFPNDGQDTTDPEWIEYCGREGLTAFSKDKNARIAHAADIRQHRINVFFLPDQQMPGAEQIKRYVDNRFRIARRAQRPGPEAYMVHPKSVERVGLP
jgi:hypothetical protein